MKKIIIAMLMVLCLVIPVSALAESSTFRQSSEIDLTHPVRINEFPSDSLKCNISVFDPQNIVIVSWQEMTNNYDVHNYTLNNSQTSKLGFYTYDITCTTGNSNKTESFEFEITTSGSQLSTAQGIIYVIVFVVSLLLLCISFIGAIRIKWSRLSDTGGETLEFNDLRYIKLVLWFVSYLLLTWIMFLSLGISQNFLFLNGASTLFNIIYTVLLLGIFPTFVIFFTVGFINIVNDRKYQAALQRGLPFR